MPIAIFILLHFVTALPEWFGAQGREPSDSAHGRCAAAVTTPHPSVSFHTCRYPAVSPSSLHRALGCTGPRLCRNRSGSRLATTPSGNISQPRQHFRSTLPCRKQAMVLACLMRREPFSRQRHDADTLWQRQAGSTSVVARHRCHRGWKRPGSWGITSSTGLNSMNRANRCPC